MTADLSRFDGGIPEHYDRSLGRYIFVDYAADLARRAAALSPQRVLELAAGTGIVSRRLRDALPEAAGLVVTDLSTEMLDVAKTKFVAGEDVEFQQANAMELPFVDGSFDLIVCQFGVMFFPDKTDSFGEALCLLEPGGHYLFSVWGTLEENPFARIAFDVASSFFQENPPEFYRIPFSYHDTDEITVSLHSAGFSAVEVETVRLKKIVPDYARFARGLVFGNPIAEEIRSRGGVEPEAVADAIATALRAEFGAEPSAMPLLAHVVRATAS